MDEDAGPSRSAVLTAVARALHLDEPGPWVLEDRFARPLAGDAGREIEEQLVADMPAASRLSFSRWCCVRTRFPEDVAEHELRTNSVRQYVLLGAGLDSFAIRRPDLLHHLRVFEVDHPSTQRWKRQRLSEIEVEPGPNLVFAPVDFERQRLDDGLREAGFDFDEPAVFVWIGVTMYLTVAAIEETLAVITACPAGTRVVLTYNQPKDVLAGLGAQTEGVLSGMIAAMGEPMITFFTPSEIESFLREHGFDEIVHVGPDEARAMYFDSRPDVQFGGAQRLIAATVSP